MSLTRNQRIFIQTNKKLVELNDNFLVWSILLISPEEPVVGLKSEQNDNFLSSYKNRDSVNGLSTLILGWVNFENMRYESISASHSQWSV